MTLRVFLADDEPLALERLSLALRDVPEAEIVGTATNGLQAIESIVALRPDVAILDIQMPGRSGLGVAAALPDDARPEIIFLTAHDSHAIDAFDLEAADYVLKPLRLDRLLQAVERARRRRVQRSLAEGPPGDTYAPSDQGERGFWVPGRQGLVLVPLDEVLWVEAAKDYVLIHTSVRSHILRTTMTAIERDFVPEELLRVHRSAAVRPGRVRGLQYTGTGAAALLLTGNVAVQIGPSYLPRVIGRFAQL